MSHTRYLISLLLIFTLVVPSLAHPAQAAPFPRAHLPTTTNHVTVNAQSIITSTLTRPPTSVTGPIELQLRSGAFDPLTTQPVIPDELRRTLAIDEAGLYLVQFSGPIRDEWYKALLKSGLEVVNYMPDYAYLVWGKAANFESLPLRWWGAYQPWYALAPQLRSIDASDTEIEVTVQIYDHSGVDDTLAAIAAAAKITRPPYPVLNYRNLRVRLTADQLSWLASLPDVVNVEPAPHFTKNDEVQGQILAGNLNTAGTQPNGPGYISWLRDTIGFTTDPAAYPIIDLVDDGLDNGTATPSHADFWTLGNPTSTDRLAYNANWTSDPLPDGGAGHGNLNASIAVGYNDQSGFPYADTTGVTANYNYGVGINPFGRVGGSKVFNNAGYWDTVAGYTDIISSSYAQGARISSNSWGCGSPYCTGAYYTADSQEYDALVRDAQPGSAVAGNQPMLIVFAAGNDGSAASTIGVPATAKNIITVGGAENYRPTASDGCNVAGTLADNAQDILATSSRGPTSDGRAKPEITAPSTHIAGAASQSANFSGAGVCGASGNNFVAPPTDAYYPAGQTLYTWSSGTSHSTPAVAGAASLIYRYYQDHFGGAAPSPAMMKAYLLNATRYLTGTGGAGNLPTTAQGFGEVYLGRAFDATPRFVVDQSHVFSGTGQAYVLQGVVAEASQPLRVTLAWTDAPGPTTGSAYVNNLDLTVTAGGSTYRGNVFSGQFSATGGAADVRNNVESVFLPAGLGGNFVITVTATNIAGDGVPGNADATDQDFALVIYNAATGALAGTVTDAITGNPIEGATLQTTPGNAIAVSDAAGAYRVTPLLSGVYTLTAGAFGYQPGSISNLTVGAGTTIQNVALTPVANYYTVSGVVKDATTGWPLYARIDISGYPTGTIWTDPVTGLYSVRLPENTTFTFDVRAWSPGYRSISRALTVTGDRTEDFDLNVDASACNAPGYQKTTTTLPNSSSRFDSNPFAGPLWREVDVNGSSGDWAYVTNGTNPTNTPHSSPGQMQFNSYSATSGHATRMYRRRGEDLSAAAGAQVSWWTYHYRGSMWDPAYDYVQVQVSTDGGTTWTAVDSPVYRYDPALPLNTGQWRPHTVDLSAFTGAGMTDVQLALLGVSDYGYNLYIDDLEMSTYTCTPQAGGLVVGNVYDATALTGLSGATVTAVSGSTTTDSRGFYTLFSPSGTHTFTATLSGYAPGITTTNVVSGIAQRVDFYLMFNTIGYVWTGNIDNDWFIAGNWNPTAVPTTTGSALIPTNPTGNRWPIVNAPTTIYSLTLQAGATLTIAQSGELHLDGAIYNFGTLAQIKDVPAATTTEFLRLTNATGTVDKYHGADVTPAGAMGLTTIQIKGNQHSCTNNPADPIVHRCFQIDPATPADAVLKFWYTEAERNGQAANALKLWHFAPWSQVGNGYAYSEAGAACASGGGQACWFRVNGINSFSPFVLGSGSAPTAVTLKSLRASTDGTHVPGLFVIVGATAAVLGGVTLKRRRRT